MRTKPVGFFDVEGARIFVAGILTLEAGVLTILGVGLLVLRAQGCCDFSFDTNPPPPPEPPLYVDILWAVGFITVGAALLTSAHSLLQRVSGARFARGTYVVGLLIALLAHGAVFGYIVYAALALTADSAFLTVWGGYFVTTALACALAFRRQIVPVAEWTTPAE